MYVWCTIYAYEKHNCLELKCLHLTHFQMTQAILDIDNNQTGMAMRACTHARTHAHTHTHCMTVSHFKNTPGITSSHGHSYFQNAEGATSTVSQNIVYNLIIISLFSYIHHTRNYSCRYLLLYFKIYSVDQYCRKSQSLHAI